VLSILLAALSLPTGTGCRHAAPPVPDSGLAPEVRAKRLEDLAQAQRDLERAPSDPEKIIWVGRRTAYLGRYREAIDIYTQGLVRHPESAALLRHRGHRYITARQFGLAIRDLERAATLIEGQPDVVEQDGIPNKRGIPTSTLQSNIWYHLGLAFYLTDQLDSALRSYRECLKVSRNPDMLCATSHWLYMTLRRLQRNQEAARVLEPISESMDIIENHAYHGLLLMYKGRKTDLQPTSPAAAYGIANWHLANGQRKKGEALMRQIVAGDQRAAFGYIAAEADLKRISKR
jgi:tetratricopeptide (TPR) repeat protein